MLVRRCCAAAVTMAVLAACGGDDTEPVDANAETTSSTAATQPAPTSEPDTDTQEPVAPAELEFRPVLELLPPGGVPGAADGCASEEDRAPDQPVLAPQVENGEEIACLRLGPTQVGGDVVESASAAEGGLGQWLVSLVLTSDGIGAFNELAGECFAGAPTCPTRQLAIVVDGSVISAPSINAPEFEPDAISISGQFTRADAEDLAARLG